jgi:hypothetical protein
LWYGGTYGLGVFIEGKVLGDNFHEKRFSQLLIQMSKCNILPQSQFVVQSCRDQNGVRISIVPIQPQEISSQELVISQGKDVT